VTGPAPRPATERRLVTRLALLYTGLSLATGVVVLVIVDLPLLTVDRTSDPARPPTDAGYTSNLPEVLGYSAVALVVLMLMSVVLGRLLATRAVRPLRVLTDSARAMSADDLPGRLKVAASYAEFTELADTLDGLARRLAAAFAAQRHFVANASHELRTPVAAQRTLLQVTLADPDADPETLRSACRQALALGEEQERLIGALLTLAHGQRGVDRREPVDLAELARDAVLARIALADRRDVRIHTELAPAPVAADPPLVASLVANLVDNAVRHSTTGGAIEITTTAAGCISIGNTGAVIDPAEVDRLFQPFQRHGTDRAGHTGGHGLGLAIVAAIADAHGATLTADARPGGGLDITVRFP
jgi:signal transduction histidine kinase